MKQPSFFLSVFVGLAVACLGKHQIRCARRATKEVCIKFIMLLIWSLKCFALTGCLVAGKLHVTKMRLVHNNELMP